MYTVAFVTRITVIALSLIRLLHHC